MRGWLPSGTLVIGMIFAGAEQASADRLLALGRHLAQECTTCHRPDGMSTIGIPSIVGRDPKDFIEALRMYRTGQRTNPTMVSVAQSLNDEQMEALARYFASLPKPEGSVAAEKSETAKQR